jgi:DNA-binding transcriptional regulator LsrR (DeoR family)
VAHIFLSHANDRQALAVRLSDALAAQGLPCVLVNDALTVPANTAARDQALLSSPVLLALLSPEYLARAWPNREPSARLFSQSPREARTVIAIVPPSMPAVPLPPTLEGSPVFSLNQDNLEELVREMVPMLRKLLVESPIETYAKFARDNRLRDLIVVETTTGDDLYTQLGKGAAAYFERHAARNFRVGLACANTIYHMVKELRPEFRVKMSAYPISFNLEPEMTNVLSAYATLIELWNRNPNCTPYAVSLPPFYVSDAERAALEERADTRVVLERIRDLNIAFYSCGYFGPGSSFDIHQTHITQYLDPSFTPAVLEELGAVGEINLNPYSLDGEAIDHPVTRSFEMLTLSQIRALAERPARHMVLVAGGQHKIAPILGALRGGYLNVLVTDQASLDAVMALDREAR